MKPHLRVALALVTNGAAWLLAQRKPDAHLGGLWEFPGGKIEAGEAPAQAALRELAEECDVQAAILGELPPVDCAYADRVVTLFPFVCRQVAGVAQPLSAAQVRWVALRDFGALPMPEVNRQIVAALGDWLAETGDLSDRV